MANLRRVDLGSFLPGRPPFTPLKRTPMVLFATAVLPNVPLYNEAIERQRLRESRPQKTALDFSHQIPVRYAGRALEFSRSIYLPL